MTRDEKIECLENDLKKTKHLITGLITIIGLAVITYFGIMFSNMTYAAISPSTASTTSQKNIISADIIKSKQFLLEDEKGRTRAILTTDGDNVGFILSNTKNIPVASLQFDQEGPGLSLAGPDGVSRLVLAVTEQGPSLTLFNEKNKYNANLKSSPEGTTLYFTGENGKPRLGLGVVEGEPGIKYFNTDGKVIGTVK